MAGNGIFLSLFFIVAVQIFAAGQRVTTNPVFPGADQSVTITVDVSGTSLDGYDWDNTARPVYIWTWIAEECTSSCDAPTNVNPATAAQAAAKCTRVSVNPDKYQITFTPTTFFNKPASSIKKIGLKLKTTDWNDNKQTDIDQFITMNDGTLAVKFIEPAAKSIFVDVGSNLTVEAVSSLTSNLKLYLNGTVVKQETSSTLLTYNYTAQPTDEVLQFIIEAATGIVRKDSFICIVRKPVVNEARPAGLRYGANYNADQTRVTLVFWAPLKQRIYAVGDFSDWQIHPTYQMKKDGEVFWLELAGLTPGEEYAYQFYVDESFYIGDPFTEKTLDPLDQYISPATYPNLKPYPSDIASGIISVFQTAQPEYVWQTSDYVRPAPEKLNVYELLVRDFDTPRNYQAVIDKLDYLQELGINAIELMPVMEFAGNDSWGYNPIFYMAPDKAYGTKSKLKELVDKAHAKGMAVILDIVLNQADYEFPYVRMYWDAGQPSADNPWFYQKGQHPFNVFFDFNHGSSYTKELVDIINAHWITEYKIDGYRFDLSKGFTTKNYCTTANCDTGAEVAAWSSYDEDRIEILKRMADKIWEVNPSTYVILEHLSDDSEERILANYGMMLWGNNHYNYLQNTLGRTTGTDVSKTYYKNHSGTPWNNPASIVAYMESHDEERLMYSNQQEGSSSGNYSVRNLSNALDRMKAAFAILFSIPGPKMMWQFGEYGYDFSINLNGRTGQKPIRWDYLDQPNRLRLYKVVSEIINLRNAYPAFHTSDLNLFLNNDLFKSVVLRSQPFVTAPTSAAQLSVVVMANFDVTSQSRVVTFPYTGKWYHYFSPADSLNTTGLSNTFLLQPGEFRIYTNYKLESVAPELTQYERPLAPTFTQLSEDVESVQLGWTDNSIIETGFMIFRSEEGGAFAVVGQVAANGTSFINQGGLKPFTNYKYFIQAYTPIGGSNSDTLSIVTTDVVTSIENNFGEELHIYPNPTNGILRLDGAQPDYQYALTTAYGGKAFLKREGLDELNLAGNPPGMYVLKILSGSLVITKKIIIAYTSHD